MNPTPSRMIFWPGYMAGSALLRLGHVSKGFDEKEETYRTPLPVGRFHICLETKEQPLGTS